MVQRPQAFHNGPPAKVHHGLPAKVEVSGTIDGSEFRMEVTEGREIQWLKRPKRKRR